MCQKIGSDIPSCTTSSDLEAALPRLQAFETWADRTYCDFQLVKVKFSRQQQHSLHDTESFNSGCRASMVSSAFGYFIRNFCWCKRAFNARLPRGINVLQVCHVLPRMPATNVKDRTFPQAGPIWSNGLSDQGRHHLELIIMQDHWQELYIWYRDTDSFAREWAVA